MNKQRSAYTEVALQVGADLKGFRDRFRLTIPASFMSEKMTPQQFKQQFGIGLREWDALKARHGEDVAQQVMDMLKGTPTAPSGSELPPPLAAALATGTEVNNA